MRAWTLPAVRAPGGCPDGGVSGVRHGLSRTARAQGREWVGIGSNCDRRVRRVDQRRESFLSADADRDSGRRLCGRFGGDAGLVFASTARSCRRRSVPGHPRARGVGDGGLGPGHGGALAGRLCAVHRTDRSSAPVNCGGAWGHDISIHRAGVCRRVSEDLSHGLGRGDRASTRSGESLMTDYTRFLSPTGRQLTESAIRRMVTVAARTGDLVSFAPGYPDPAVFPWQELREISAGLLDGHDADTLQYGPTRGYRPLLESALRGLACESI